MWHGPLAEKDLLIDGLNQMVSRFFDAPYRPIPDIDPSHPLFVISDYGGKHKSSKCETYSFLAFQPTKQPATMAEIHTVFQEGMRGRSIAYKNFVGDCFKRNHIEEYIRRCTEIEGLLFTFCVDRQLSHMFDWSHQEPEVVTEVSRVMPLFKPAVRPHVGAVIAFATTVICGLAKYQQNITWITDEDNIISNPHIRESFLDGFVRMSRNFLPHDVGRLKFDSTKEVSPHWKNLSSVPDLIAGSLSDCITAEINQQVPWADHEPRKVELSPKATIIADGFFRENSALMPVTIRVRGNSKGEYENISRYTRLMHET